MKGRGRYTASGAEAEFEPGSKGRVLRNKLGLRLVREIHRAEFDSLVRATDSWFHTAHIDQTFTAADIRQMHRDWLGEIYEWAGEYRTVDLAKPEIRFANAGQIHRLMNEFERKHLAERTPCLPGDSLRIAQDLAVVHAELILIHPFREGNGRCARLLSALMGLQAGLPALQFDRFDGRGKRRYFAAILASFGDDYWPLTERFASVIQKTLQNQRRGALV